MPEFYGDGQFTNIVPFWNAVFDYHPNWFILGGPADGNEAHHAGGQWPGVRVLACEPNPEAYWWQKRNGWPRQFRLLNVALGERDGEDVINVVPGFLRSASMEDKGAGSLVPASVYTLDTLDATYGPFDRAVLWLDVEGSELAALRGAEKMLKRGAVDMVNVEVQARRRWTNMELEELLALHRFEQVGRWNDSDSCEDRVYVRR